MRASDLHKPRPHLRLNPSHTSIKPAQTSTTPVSESLSCLHQTCTNLTHSCVWILLIQASNLHKPHPLLHLIPSHTRFKPAQTSPTLASESFSCMHQTFANLNHSCLWIRLIQASNLHKAQPLLHLIPSHTSIKPAQTSPFPASQSLSCEYQTCTNLTHSCAWILFMLASNLRKPHHSCLWIRLIQASNLHKAQPLLHLIPSHTSIKPAQISPFPASQSLSCEYQTCTNLNHSCVWILLRLSSNLRKPHPFLRLNPYHASIKPAQTSPIPASESFSYKHQTCTNLTHSCVWILLMLASNLRKPQPLLPLNPSHTSIKPAQNSNTPAADSFSYKHQTCKNLNHSCVWILLMLSSNLRKPHLFLRLNLYHAWIKLAQTSPTPASKSLSCVHQTCTNLAHTCVWILLIQASNLHKPHLLLCLNRSHACIKPAQTSPTPASESFSSKHQTCTNLTHSCIWFLLIQASNLHKPHPLLRLNPSRACIKPAQTSTTPASESVSHKHQTCTYLTHSCIWILLIQASNLRKPHPHLRLNPSHACIKPAQTSPTSASESFSYKHQTCKKLTHSCLWILLIQASNLHKPHPLLHQNPSHAWIKPAQTSPTLRSESFSCLNQICTNLVHSCVWILIMRASNLPKPHPLLRLNPYHAFIRPAQTSPTPASESFSYKHQTCENLTHSCVWILLMLASNLHKPHPLLRLNPSHTSIKPA